MPAPAVAPPSTTPTPSTPGPVPDDCGREPGFDQWAGGRRMRLETGDLLPGGVAALTVSGAIPGEQVTIQLGDLCTLDCPPELDGACFQPIAPTVLGSVTADPAGTGVLSVPVDPDWEGRWLVLQATTTDSVSQAVVDRVLTDAEPLGVVFPGELKWISPVTLRHQVGDSDLFTWDVAAGRRVVVAYDVTSGYDIEGYVSTTVDGAVRYLPWLGDDTRFLFDEWSAGPSNWAIEAAFDYWSGHYDLDVTTVPLAVAVDWYPDGDGDGYGDPSGVPTSSDEPVAGASPDARDCDDADPALHPNGAEVCGDTIDQDCDSADRACSMDAGTTTLATAGTRLTGEAGTRAGQWLAAGDLDADGIVDLVAGGSPGFVQSVSRTDTLPSRGLSVPRSMDGAVGDLTGDGIDDLALVDEQGEVTVHRGPLVDPIDPDSAVIVVSHPTQMIGAEIGDATGDGQPDLLIVGRWDLSLYAGPLGASPPVDLEIPAQFDGTRPAAVFSDADGDGLDDVWTHDVCLYLAPVDPLAAGCVDDGAYDNLAWAGMSSLDADGDGLADLAAGTGEGVSVFLGPLSGVSSIADAAWFTALDPGFQNWSSSTLVPDSDGDGAPELVLVSLENGEAWTVAVAGGGVVDRSSGSGVWSGATLPALLGADLDGDGSGDLVLADPDAAWGSDWSAGVLYLSWGR